MPKGLGTEIMARFGVPPTKLLGDIRKKLEQAADDGTILSGQPIEYYLQALEERPDDFGLPALAETPE